VQKTVDYKVRAATLEDVIDLVLLGKTALKGGGHSRLGWNSAKAFEFYSHCVNDESFFIECLVSEDEGVVGFLTGFTAASFFSHALQATEITWFVLPEHRKSVKSIELLKHFETWAADKGAVNINMGSLECAQPEKLAKLYKSRGYSPSEHTFVKELT